MIEPIDYSLPPEQMYEIIEEKIESNRSALASLKMTESPTFATLVFPIEQQDEELSQLWSIASHLQSVNNQEQFRQRHQEIEKKLSAHYSEIGFDRELMDLFKTLSSENLNDDERLVIQRSLLNFKLSGVDLPKAQQDELFALRQELSAKTTKFSENVIDATDKWVIDLTEDDLQGLNDNQKSYLAHLAKAHQRESAYCAGLDAPSYSMILTYAQKRSLREKIYKAYTTKASPLDQVSAQYDNTTVTKEIIELRSKIAKVLGYKNYLELSLAEKFAQSPQEVENFLLSMIEKVRPQALAEKKELEEFIGRQKEAPRTIEPWDLTFYAQKYKQEKLDYDEELIRQYFPTATVLEAMFSIFGELYHFTVVKRPEISLWHEDAVAYTLYDAQDNTKVIGSLYVDLYARQKKRSGAWMSDARSFTNYQSWKQTPVAHLICNFQKSDEPTLTFNDVQTLFHEFGHTLHHLLTKRSLPSIAGISQVPWDIVELPSQLQEQWCFETGPLTQLSSHKDSQEPLPEAMQKTLQESRQFHSASHLLRQLEFSLYDWKIFEQEKVDDPVGFWKELRKPIALYPTQKDHAFPLSFSHIFAGGYAAGYYSYLWAETYAHQVYHHLKAQNFSQEVAQGYLKDFLSCGGDLNLKEHLHHFLGEEQKIEPLLHAYGIKQAS